MSVWTESGIRIDLAASVWHEKFDAANGGIWPGVDFRIDDHEGWVWLELKNWEPSNMPAKFRGGQRRRFLSLMKVKSAVGNAFFQGLREKFLGTSAYLLHTGAGDDRPVTYVVLLESPKLDSALKLHATQRLSGSIRPGRPWKIGIGVAVVDSAEWNSRYPRYPAQVL